MKRCGFFFFFSFLFMKKKRILDTSQRQKRKELLDIYTAITTYIFLDLVSGYLPLLRQLTFKKKKVQ